MGNGFSIESAKIGEFAKRIESGFGSYGPLATKTAAEIQETFGFWAVGFYQKDKDENGYIDEGEFLKSQRDQKFPCKNDEEAKRLFAAIAENGKISPERYGAFSNVRSTGDGMPLSKYVSGGVNNLLEKVAKEGPNTLGFCNNANGFDKPILTLGQAIDLVQYGEIKYATTEQIEKGYLELRKIDEK